MATRKTTTTSRSGAGRAKSGKAAKKKTDGAKSGKATKKTAGTKSSRKSSLKVKSYKWEKGVNPYLRCPDPECRSKDVDRIPQDFCPGRMPIWVCEDCGLLWDTYGKWKDEDDLCGLG